MSTNMNVKKAMTSILLILFIFCTLNLAAAPNSPIISKQQASAMVKDYFGGKVLKVKLVEKPDLSFYKVKLLTKKGRVKQVRIDSRTGEILNNR